MNTVRTKALNKINKMEVSFVKKRKIIDNIWKFYLICYIVILFFFIIPALPFIILYQLLNFQSSLHNKYIACPNCHISWKIKRKQMSITNKKRYNNPLIERKEF